MRIKTAFVVGAILSGALGGFSAYSMDSSDEDPHAHHHHMMESPAPVRRTEVTYQVPAVKLVRDDGKAVAIRKELAADKPVVLAFIYTTCTTVCPLTSQTLAQLQAKLGPDRDQVRMVSISIDPEEDTPARLTEYAQRYRAGAEWRHYTGTVEDSQAVQRAFDIFRGNKMNHAPAIFVRNRGEDEWIRFDGFATAEQIYAELKLKKQK